MTSGLIEAKFGIFVHWDHASQQGIEISWPMAGGAPIANKRRWVRRECSDVQPYGMGCPPASWVLTSLWRPVRGFYHQAPRRLFHVPHRVQRLLDRKCTISQRLGQEFVAAAHEEGLKVGLYYSLSDWHNEYYPALRRRSPL